MKQIGIGGMRVIGAPMSSGTGGGGGIIQVDALPVGMEWDNETTGVLQIVNSDFAGITAGEINSTTGELSMTVEV